MAYISITASVAQVYLLMMHDLVIKCRLQENKQHRNSHKESENMRKKARLSEIH